MGKTAILLECFVQHCIKTCSAEVHTEFPTYKIMCIQKYC